ncbi:hypothetical protein RF11_00268 [Thelohanellus kitauei]|uniref:BPTI/Kunitz inhibitor domain-containing protein n=1 Tax=Thelohanellus kitauei TaxID=669202 RepID=A0A0C2J3D7_THEKT|nr:hypothetical protein RF11_00268 [Thelohanellus kitauei]
MTGRCFEENLFKDLSYSLERPIGSCWESEERDFYYYDSVIKGCAAYRSCGEVSPDANRFETPDCLIIWMNPSDPIPDPNRMAKKAFNRYTGECESYVEQKGYPIPPLFTTYAECEKYCLNDDEY